MHSNVIIRLYYIITFLKIKNLKVQNELNKKIFKIIILITHTNFVS